MYVIEMASGGIFEAELGRLKDKCKAIAKHFTDRDIYFQTVDRLGFVGRDGTEIDYGKKAITQLEDLIHSHQEELLAMNKADDEYNKCGHNYTDNHF